MITRPLAGLTLCLALASCDNAASTPARSATPTARPAATSPPIIDLTHATAAKGSPTDTSVPLHPRLYSDPGNPCAGVIDNIRTAKAPAACGIPFIDLGSNLIAGSQIITYYSGPKTATAQAGVTATFATSIGNGFEVSDAVRLWAISANAPNIIPLTDVTGQSTDPIYKTIAAKTVTASKLPACVFPTSIRIAEATPEVISYLQGLGWAIPSNSAVVASYDACPGMTVTFSDGTSVTLLGHTQKVSIVTTGSVLPVVPFGPLFVEDGWAPCGPAALHSVCG